MTGDEIKASKDIVTEAIKDVVDILENYTDSVTIYPPYVKKCFYLHQSDFPNEAVDTNKLSQIVFVSYKNTIICVPGDLTSSAWDKILLKNDVTTLLKGTNIFIASHHGREDGFNENIFNYCKPECIVLSDKYIIHGTQEGMSSKYGNYVNGNGIILNGNNNDLRKTLTTRSDGHIWIRINDDGSRVYNTF